jgi:hypothetical protein
MHYLPILASYNWLDTAAAKKFFKKKQTDCHPGLPIGREGLRKLPAVKHLQPAIFNLAASIRHSLFLLKHPFWVAAPQSCPNGSTIFLIVARTLPCSLS